MQDTAGGATNYFAWVELLPGAVLPIGNAPVSPGDVVQATIVETGVNVWTVSIQDTTAGWSYAGAFNYTTPGTSAEWIEEAPTVGGSQSNLANFGVTTFANAQVTGSNPGFSVLNPVYMLNATQTAIIAYPGAFDSVANSFSDHYGTPPPAVTSVSPSVGSPDGGLNVTIQGDFLATSQLLAVAFGAHNATFVLNGDGSISVVSPPEPAGTVDITVTTVGGTSALSSADQFTYASPPPPPTSTPTTAPPQVSAPASASSPMPEHGYWLVGADGGIFTFGSAQFHGSTGNLHLQRPVVGITPTSDRAGYWLVASDGGIFSFGNAGFYGSIPGLGLAPAGTANAARRLSAPVVGMVPSADGGGYFMVASDGGVFAFGDARFAGSCPGIGGCAGSAVAVMPDSSGNGYWLVTKTGNVYSFGDAAFYGAPGSQGSVATSAIRTPDGNGYWILFADGSVSGFGDAVNLGGPTGALRGTGSATAIFTSADGGGYWVASSSGGVFTYGDAPYDGSMGGNRLNAPVIAATGW